MTERGEGGSMEVEPTLPLPGAGAPGHFPPPTDPWSAPTPPNSAAPTRPTAPAVPTQSGPPHPQPYPIGSGSGGVAPAAPAPGGPGPVVAQIGEISVTSSTVHTPAGDIALARSTWQVSDFWQTEQKTPTWAIVLAIVGFCVLTVLSLLFLLIKETIYRGTVQVTVTNGPRQYVARIPVSTQAQVQQIHQQVNYVRSLAAL